MRAPEPLRKRPRGLKSGSVGADGDSMERERRVCWRESPASSARASSAGPSAALPLLLDDVTNLAGTQRPSTRELSRPDVVGLSRTHFLSARWRA